MDIPLIRIEMEGIKKSVMTHLAGHNEDMNHMITDALKATLNEEWVKSEIQKSVDKCVRGAIDNLAHSYQLRSAVESTLAAALPEMIKSQ